MQLFHHFSRSSSNTLSRALAASSLNPSSNSNDKNWLSTHSNAAPISYSAHAGKMTTAARLASQKQHRSASSAASASVLLSNQPLIQAATASALLSQQVAAIHSHTPSSSSSVENKQMNENDKDESARNASTISLMALSGITLAAAVVLASSAQDNEQNDSSSSSSSSSSLSLSSSIAPVISSLFTPSVALAASAPPPSAASAVSSAPLLSFQLNDEKAPEVKKKEDSSQKLPLENPGKFDHLTRDVQFALTPQVFGGARIQWVLPQFDPEAEKQLVMIGGLHMGDQMHGSSASVQVISQLGKAHEFRANWDTNGTATGRYKYRKGRWGLKSEFHLSPMFNALVLGSDYRSEAWTAHAELLNGRELTLSYVRALTRQLQAGVQLQHAYEQHTLLNWIAKYNEDEQNSFVLTDRLNAYSLSYLRKVDKTLSLGTEFRFNKTDHESQTVVGILYRRFAENFPLPSFTYQANINTQGVLSMLLETPVTPGITFGISGMVAHDGSNEAQFGISLSVGQ